MSSPKIIKPAIKIIAPINEDKQCRRLTLKNFNIFLSYPIFCLEYLRSATETKPKSAYFDKSEKNKEKDKIPKPVGPRTLASIIDLSN